MTIFQLKPTANRALHFTDTRQGITVIEVLTAMLVALIGVFGVLVLIPFSVQQAQLGLDQDAAGVMAENAIEDIKIMGLTSVTAAAATPTTVTQTRFRGATIAVTEVPVGSGNLVPGVVLPATVNGGANTQLTVPTILHFDPIAVANVGFPVAAIGAGDNADCFNLLMQNPDFLTGSLPATRNDLRFPVVTATSQFEFTTGTSLIGRQEAERIFRNQDEVQYDQPEETKLNALGSTVTDLDIPQPVYDINSTGNLVRSQTLGTISWSAIFVPQKPNRVKPLFFQDAGGTIPYPATKPNRFKVYTLVYKDRSVLPAAIDLESIMFAAPVVVHTAPFSTAAAVGGYVAAVDRIPIDPSFAVDPDIVKKDDWVMLINRRPAPYYPDAPAHAGLPAQQNGVRLSAAPAAGAPRFAADESGYDIQVAFAKIRSLNGQTLYVEGGPFNFYSTAIAGAPYGLLANGTADGTYTAATQVIHLRNVVTVYERTVSIETSSTWN